MNMFKRILSVAAIAAGCLLPSLATAAQTQTAETNGYTWSYTVIGAEATITEIQPTPHGALEIPAELGGNPVTEIGEYAFCGCSSLTSVLFPPSMREIDNCAFADCPNLSEIVLNEGLDYIGPCAFGSSAYREEEMVFNVKLTHVNIPASVRYIDDEIFLGCTNLTEITGGEGVVNCATDPFGWNVPAFPLAEVAPDGKTPLPFKVHKIGKVVFGFQGICPDRLAAADFGDALTIVDSAFDADWGPSVTNLVSLVLPDTLENIGSYAFYGASSLVDIDFGGNASQLYIHSGAFEGAAIRELKGEFGYVDAEAFAYCPNLVTAEIAADTLDGYDIFAGCRALETLRVDAPTVPDGLCIDCPSLVSVVFSERVKLIGQNAFADCASLKSVVFDGNAPTTRLNVYLGTPDDLTNYVCRDSVGWTGPKAGGLPEAWPVGDAYARPIAYREDVPTITYSVTFDLGEHGTRTGGGALKQRVVEGGDAVAPVVQPDEGFSFVGWSWPFANVTETMTVKALYRDAGGRPVDWYDVGGGCVIDLTEYMEEDDWGEIYRYWDMEGDDLVTVYSSELEAYLELNFPRRGFLTFEYKVESSEPGVYPNYSAAHDDTYLKISTPEEVYYRDRDLGWGTCRFAISEPGQGVANIYASSWMGGTPLRLHLRNFQWEDAPEYVTITLDPKLGKLPAGQDAELRLRTDGTFGDLPVPVREGCEFLGWTYEKVCEFDEVEPDTPVPLYDMTLTAQWDVPLEVVVNPNGDLDDLSFNGDWGVNARKESGLEIDPATGEVVTTDPVWHEYAYSDEYEIYPNSTVEAFSATFKDAGILNFSELSGSMYTWYNYQSIGSFTVFVDGEPVEQLAVADWYQVGYSYLVKSAGDHRLSISFENECDRDASAYLHLGAITFDPAPAEIEVTFDPKGGSAAYTTKTYKTGVAYGELPSVAERPGCEFLGWFNAAQGGRKVEVTDFVDFTVTELYAQWRTDLNTALDNKDLAFVSGGPTGWAGQSGVSHDGIAAAASGFLDYNETNTLSTTVTGKGVLSFWWKTDDGDGLAKMDLALTVDGRTTWLGKPYEAGDGWLNFALTLTNDGPHTVTWSASVDSTEYNEWAAYGAPTLAELIADPNGYLGQLAALDQLTLPGAWIDQVVWTPDETVDVVKWGDSSLQANRFLPGSGDDMIAKCDARIKADANDYEAHIRRAISRLKKLGEDQVFAQLLVRYGYAFSGELMAFVGELDVTDAPLSNDAVDTVAAEALPALADILADLETVPEGWTGCVALSPEQYPVDEPVYVDYADVTLAKAAVHGAKAAVLAAKGYGLTIDNQKMYEEVVASSNKETLTVAEFTGDWTACPASRMKGFGTDGFVRLAAKEKLLLVRFTLPTNLPPECATAECVTAELELANDEFDSLWLTLDLGEGQNKAFAAFGFTDAEVGVVQTRTEGGYDLEIDLSSLADFKPAVGMKLNEASVVWGVFGEEVFYGETYQVVESVFELVSDGKIDNPDLLIESILAAHPKFAGEIRDQASLTAAKGELRAALGLYGVFDVAVRSRTTDDLHFFECDPQNAEQWDAIRDAAKLALEALDGVVTVKGEDYACFKNFKWTNLNERVSLKPFFDGKILRSLLPPFEGNRPVLSAIPDITFAGTFPDWTMENQMYWLEKIDGVWYDVPPVVPVVTNTITYVGLEGAANTNVTEFTTNDLPLVLGPVEREGYAFLGWTPNGGVIPVGTVTNVTFAATWRLNAYVVRFDANGGTGEMADQSFEYGRAQALARNRFERAGYAFSGWAYEADAVASYADGEVVSNLTAEADAVVTLFALWVGDEISFDLPDGFTLKGRVGETVALPDDWPKTGYKFVGWLVGGTAYRPGETFVVPPKAVAIEPVYELDAIHSDESAVIHEGEVAPYETAAATYDGYLYDGESIVGSVQVKVAKGKKDKKTGVFTAKVTATVQLADEAKKLSFKDGLADEAGRITEMSDKTGNRLAVSVGVNGLGGTFRRAGSDTPYRIDGARNFFVGKTDADKALAATVARLCQETYNVALDGGTLTVAVDKKGKAKIAGTVDGNKVSATSQLLVGDGVAAIPVVIVKKVNIAFCLWLTADGTTEVLGAAGIAGKPDRIKSGATFTFDAVEFAKLFDGLYADFLPNGLAVDSDGRKWVVANGAKVGKLVLLDKTTGELDLAKSKFTDNTSGLKLTYKEKDGTFTGAFKVYAFEKGKIKAYSASVTGVMVGDRGYGTATVKKVGSVAVSVQ